MEPFDIAQGLANFGSTVVLAALLISGILVTQKSVDKLLSERDKGDRVRDERLADQKELNALLTEQLEKNTEAFRRIADELGARNRAEAELRRESSSGQRSK